MYGWPAAAEVAEAAAATALAAGGETRKLLPHFLHLIRAPINSGVILPFSPQVGHVTVGIVQTSPGPGRRSRRRVIVDVITMVNRITLFVFRTTVAA